MKYKAYPKSQEIIIDTETGIISGRTYHAKDEIKFIFKGAKWDGGSKSWTMDPQDMMTILEAEFAYIKKYWELHEIAPATIKVQTATATTTYRATSANNPVSNGLCPKCKTYCYGDCK